MRLQCSICSGPSDLRQAIDESIRQGVRYRDIAEQCGGRFSKSALHRHSKHVHRSVLARCKKRMLCGRVIVQWPDGEYTLQGKEFDPDQLADSDTIVCVGYKRAEIRNLPALIDTAWLEMAADFAARQTQPNSTA